MRRSPLVALALFPPPVDCWLGQQMAPPERCSLRCCDDAGEQPPAALRNAAPSPALVRSDGLSGCTDCSALYNGLLQPVVLDALGACNCVRPPEIIRPSGQLLAVTGYGGVDVVCGEQWQSRLANAFHWLSPRRLLLLCGLIAFASLWFQWMRVLNVLLDTMRHYTVTAAVACATDGCTAGGRLVCLQPLSRGGALPSTLLQMTLPQNHSMPQ